MKQKMKYVLNKYENNVDFIPKTVEGKYQIPAIMPEDYVFSEFVSFSKATQCVRKEDKCIHFFLDDYRFANIWVQREKYRNLLPQFNAVMTPDFSLYTDWPFMVQLWNHYRKHLIGAWMQSIGCRVYPTIAWSDEDSYSWCFDGEPVGATVCVGSVGTQMNKRSKYLFQKGYEKMMEVLQPETILFYGQIPAECKGNIIPIEPYTERFKGGKENDKA